MKPFTQAFNAYVNLSCVEVRFLCVCRLLSDALHLSSTALQRDPRQLASQILGRMHDIITKDIPIAPGDPVKYPFLKPIYAQAR